MASSRKAMFRVVHDDWSEWTPLDLSDFAFQNPDARLDCKSIVGFFLNDMGHLVVIDGWGHVYEPKRRDGMRVIYQNGAL